jgi:hypothetical protein
MQVSPPALATSLILALVSLLSLPARATERPAGHASALEVDPLEIVFRDGYEPGVALDVTTAGTGEGVFDCKLDGAPGFSACASTYSFGTSVQIRALPSATAPTHSSVAAWSGDCAATGAGSICTVTMTAPRATAITFNLDFVIVSLTIVGTGTVNDSGATFTCSSGTCMKSYLWGVAVSFPKPAGNFVSWAGACTGGNACILSANTMQNNSSLTATFVP